MHYKEEAPRRIGVLLVGPGGVGKTEYVQTLQTGGYGANTGTMQYKLAPWKVSEKSGYVQFTLHEVNSAQPSEAVKGAEGVVAMYDIRREKESSAELEKMHLAIVGAHPGMPTALCSNKVDLVKFPEDGACETLPEVDPVDTYRILQRWKAEVNGCTHHFYLSSKSGYQLLQPLLYIASVVLNDRGVD